MGGFGFAARPRAYGGQRIMEHADRETIAHIIPHTHWDRAWYLPFERFRAGLPALFESIFAFLADPGNPPFLLDGQTILLDDYLELEPDRRDALRDLISAGRLSVGPFYAQVDLMLSHPEAIVRNLMIGLKAAGRMGRATMVGYFPDSWGLPRQLPQILRGSGIKAAVFGRGFKEDIRETGVEFRYVGIDGSELPFVFMPGGYINGINLGYAGKWGDPAAQPFDGDRAVADLVKAIGDLSATTRSRHLLIMNGGDHERPDPRLSSILEATAGRNSAAIDRGGMEAFADAIVSASPDLPAYAEDIVYGRYSYMVHGISSSRAYLKQRQARLSRRLVSAIEPMAGALGMLGRPIEGCLLERAWKLLLQNLVHDEIGGCSLDQVHREMMIRYDMLEQLLDGLEEECALELAGLTPASPGLGEAQLLFNPSSAPTEGPLRVELSVDPRRVDPDRLMAVDGSGEPIRARILGWRKDFAMRINAARSRVIVDAVVEAGVIDPYSFRTIYLCEGDAAPAMAPAQSAGASAAGASAAGAGAVLENALVKLEFRDGAFALRDKRNGREFIDFLRLTDEADSGDEYSFSPLEGEVPAVLSFAEASAESLERGPLFASIRVRGTWALPSRLDRNLSSRSREAAAVGYALTMELLEGSPDIRVRVELDNQAEDHRMRLRFALRGLDSSSHRAGAHYGERELPNLPQRIDEAGWKESFPRSSAFVGYVAASDERGGLVIASDDTREYEFSPGPIVDFTLFRGVGDLSREDLTTRRGGAGFSFATPEAQCRGRLDFRFGLRLSDDPASCRGARAYGAADSLTSSALAIDCADLRGALPGEFHHPDMPADLPLKDREPAASATSPRVPFRVVSEDAVVCAFKPSDEGAGCVLRILNYSAEAAAARILVDESLVARATETDLCEAPLRELDIAGGVISVELRAFGLATILLEGRNGSALDNFGSSMQE
jgi:mannosylglycerate hydrolase